jgi:hypothetical protein
MPFQNLFNFRSGVRAPLTLTKRTHFISASQILTSKEKDILHVVQEQEQKSILTIVEATRKLLQETIPTTATRLVKMTESTLFFWQERVGVEGFLR